MKAIILAAGSGRRLNKYTHNLPKGMLNVLGMPLILHQVNAYLRCGIQDITIVKGYFSDKIEIEGTKSYINEKYATTNMVESLFCAESELSGDLIISYADIIFEDRLLQKAMEFKHDIGVTVDTDWKEYWKMRYGKVDFDTESLKFNDQGKIIELGILDPPLEEIDGRYVGLIRLSGEGTQTFISYYHKLKDEYQEKRFMNNRLFEMMFMTDFLQHLINSGVDIYPIKIKRGWLEFDTNEDYEKILELQEKQNLGNYFNL